MTKLAAVITTLLATTTVAAAQPTEVAEKSEQSAFGLALLGTAAPLALTIAGASTNQDGLTRAGALGMLIGPSAGHWYAGKIVTTGMAVRGAGTLVMLAGVAQAIGNIDCEDSCSSGGGTLMAAGGLLFLGGTIHDLATAGRAAREWNATHLAVGPTVVGTGGRSTLGIGARVAF